MAAPLAKPGGGPLRVALVQMLVGGDKAANVRTALRRVAEAAGEGARLVVLPECFNAPYGGEHFGPYAEAVPQGDTCGALADAAREHKIYLVGGSVPECDAGRLYNTSATFGPDGALLAKHRKVHLFDIDVPGKIAFRESDTLSAGDAFTTFDTDWCKVGVGICFDVRFAEMATHYAKQGCALLVYPGAFNTTTGPAHWSLLHRTRAVDCQAYCVACSPARHTGADATGYPVWGHSMVVDPWGSVLAEADENETILYADLDMRKCDEVRRMVPVLSGRRTDLYDTVLKADL